MKIDSPPKRYSEQEIAEGINHNNEVILTDLVHRLKPRIFKWILKDCKGTVEEAEDNFQDTWLAVITNIKQRKYKADHFESYFTAVSKYIWFRSKHQWRVVSHATEFDMKDYSEEELHLKLLKDKRYDIVYQKLMELSEERRQVLELRFYEGAKLKEIAKKMNLTEDFVKVRLYRCKQYLLKLVKNDPDFTME